MLLRSYSSKIRLFSQTVLYVLSYNIAECRFRGQLMLQTHKYHINTSITGTCIKQSFTISYIHKFICMLKAKKKCSKRIHSSDRGKKTTCKLYIETFMQLSLCKKPFSLTACDRNANQK
ncbi:conserved hypothetical protein [Trichinella spiralis]|uniref:hypothetical protein n=1 Tax=Trichinella spiralis TaxID=6334 RepID=UPI0001EFD4AE|nr:conserved hypothetical protein [Trichinella spiralis]